jgi:hypothetical protein
VSDLTPVYGTCCTYIMSGRFITPAEESELGAMQEKFDMRRKGRPGMTRSHVLIRVPDWIKPQYNCFNLTLEG